MEPGAPPPGKLTRSISARRVQLRCVGPELSALRSVPSGAGEEPAAPPPSGSAFDDVQKGGGDYTRSQSLEAGQFALFLGGKRIPVRPTPPRHTWRHRPSRGTNP